MVPLTCTVLLETLPVRVSLTSTVTLRVCVSAAPDAPGWIGICGSACRITAAENPLDTMPITSAVSCAEKLPVVGSDQLDPPPHATNAAVAATKILLFMYLFPPTS